MPITLTKLRNLISQSDTYDSAMRRSMLLAEDAYSLRLASGIKLPADTPVHYPSTAPAIVDHFVDQVRTENIEVSLGPLGKGSKAQERRDLLEAYGRYALEQLLIHEDEPLVDYMAFSLGLLGASVTRVLFDESKWSDNPDEQKYLWPFAVRTVHPTNIMIAPGHRWPYAYVIEKQERYVGEIQADYPDWKPLDKKGRDAMMGATDGVDVYIYWDADTYAMFAGNNLVFEKPNLLGIPPYMWGFSGLGHKSADADPDSQAIGILKHVISELQSEIRLKTAADASWMRYVWPTLFGTIPVKEMETKWSAGPGRYIEIDEMDEMPKFLESPQINQGMWTMIPTLRASMEREIRPMVGAPGYHSARPDHVQLRSFPGPHRGDTRRLLARSA